MQIIVQHLPNFLLVFCRLTAFFVVAPVFSTRGVPGQIKIGLGFFASLLVYVGMETTSLLTIDGLYLLLIVQEILVGALLGFLAYLFFTAVQVAGSFVDLQMGFGIANVVDPMTGAQSPIIGNFNFLVAFLLFLSINGHHHLLLSAMKSYEWIPFDVNLLEKITAGHITEHLIKSFVVMFALAFQMSAPLIASLFVVDVALGMLARTVPQFNVFVIGLPLKITVGFIILLLMVPSYLYLFQNLFYTLFESVHELMMIIGV